MNRVYIVAVRWCKNDKYIHTFMMYVYIYKKMFCLQPHVHCTCFFSVFFSVVVCGQGKHLPSHTCA